MHCILRDVVRDDLSLSERRQFRRPRKQCGLGGWPEPHLFLISSQATVKMTGPTGPRQPLTDGQPSRLGGSR
jgi:hypothetical protein